MEKKGGSGKFIVFGLIIGAATGAAALYVPLASYLAPTFLAFVFAAWGAFGIIPALIGAVGVTLALTDAVSAAYMLSLYIPASLIIGYVIGKQKPWRTAVAISALAMGLSLYLNLCLPSMLAGESPFSQIQSMMQENADYVMQGLTAVSASGDEAALIAIKETLRSFTELAPQITMYFVCGFPMLFSLVDVLIARALAKKAGAELRPMAHFALWQLSKQYGYVSFAALAGTIAVLVIGLENADAVFAAAVSIVMMPLMLIGVCYMEFSLRMGGKKNPGRRVMFFLFALLLLPYSLIFMGLMDRVTKIRKNYTTKNKTDEN